MKEADQFITFPDQASSRHCQFDQVIYLQNRAIRQDQAIKQSTWAHGTWAHGHTGMPSTGSCTALTQLNAPSADATCRVDYDSSRGNDKNRDREIV
jgi:hypothetical protein